VHGRTDRFVMRFRRADRTPSILQIVIEHIEPGREADYSAIEERLAEICVVCRRRTAISRSSRSTHHAGQPSAWCRTTFLFYIVVA